MRNAWKVVMWSCVVSTAGCGSSRVVDDSAAAAEQIRKLDELWSATAAKNDLEGTLSFYADDAVVLPGNAPIVTDKKAIRELWAGMLGPSSAVSWKVLAPWKFTPLARTVIPAPSYAPINDGSCNCSARFPFSVVSQPTVASDGMRSTCG